MRLMKWAMLAAIGCGPALVFSEEPAQQKKENPAKFGLRIEIQSDDGKPKVFVLGDGDSAESKEGAQQAHRLGELLNKGNKEGITFTLDLKETDEPRGGGGALKPGQPITIRPQVGQNPLGQPGAPMRWYLAERKHEKGTYLGITTDSPPPVLRKQLGLAKGMALVVENVIPGSPAAKAGLEEFDVIQKLDDQLIVNQPQLSVLVRAHKPGDEVKITVIREAKPTVVTAKLVEHEIEEAEGGQEEMIKAHLRGMLGAMPPQGWQMLERREGREGREGRGGPQAGGGLAPGAVIGAPRPVSKTLIEGNRTYTLTASPWGRSFVVTEGENHKQIFAASVATKEQREKVPADMKEMLEKLEKSMPKLMLQTNPGSPQLPPGASVPNPNPNPNPKPNQATKKEKSSDEK
jgi:hypothetical protein